ncbi:MAG TPA: E3 binding domain-containing protein [Armatimonadota bacterium]|nr:E3 binding domain-containing protein [Armatimonadota bacterium]
MAEHRAQAEAEFELDLDLSAVAGRGATASSGRVRATPAARRLAREHNVAIEDVARALDLDGVVGEDDVRRYLDR